MRRALAECLNRRFFGFEPVCVGWTALCLIEAGLLDEAEVILNESLERSNYRQVRTAGTYYLHEARTRLAMGRGNAAEATTIAAQALNHCRDCGEVMHELHALVLCAEVSAAFAQPVGDLSELHAKVTKLGIAPLLKRLNALAEHAG